MIVTDSKNMLPEVLSFFKKFQLQGKMWKSQKGTINHYATVNLTIFLTALSPLERSVTIISKPLLPLCNKLRYQFFNGSQNLVRSLLSLPIIFIYCNSSSRSCVGLYQYSDCTIQKIKYKVSRKLVIARYRVIRV